MKQFIILLAFFAISSNSFSKDHILKTHTDLIAALSEIRSNCESIKAEEKTWKGDDAKKAQLLYITLKGKSDALIDKYKSIIPDWRKASKLGINVENELVELKNANNEFVKFFKDNFSKHDPKPNLKITTEMINLVFDAGKKIYDFVKGISDAKKKLWSDQVEAQRIKTW